MELILLIGGAFASVCACYLVCIAFGISSSQVQAKLENDV